MLVLTYNYVHTYTHTHIITYTVDIVPDRKAYTIPDRDADSGNGGAGMKEGREGERELGEGRGGEAREKRQDRKRE